MMRFLIRVRFISYGILGLLLFILITLYHTKMCGELPPASVTKQMGSRNVTEVVKPRENTILSEPSRVNEKQVSAVVLVTSTTEAREQREAVRRTWGLWAKELDLKVYFTMGINHVGESLPQSLWAEQSLHNDLIIDNYEEGYYRLSGKMLRMLKWVNATFSQAKLPLFFIKTDHDVFLNLPNIVRSLMKTPYYHKIMSFNATSELRLDRANYETYYVGGQIIKRAKVAPSPKSKWHLSSADRKILKWEKVLYPSYIDGTCYVLSGNVAKLIYEASFNVPIFPFEDIYLTGFVAHEYLKLSISSMQGMWESWRKWDWYTLYKMQIMHPVESQEMFKICQKLESCTNVSSSGSSDDNDDANK